MSGTAIKLVALVLMLIDHVGQFIPGMPMAFHWVGRVSAPLFLFCMIWGLVHTRSRLTYLSRMYGIGLFMGVVSFVLNMVFSDAAVPLTNNIFVTLFVTGVIISIYDMFQSDPAGAKRLLTMFLVLQGISILVTSLIYNVWQFDAFARLYLSFLPNVFHCEGGVAFVVLGVFMYLYKDDIRLMSIFFAIICGVYLVTAVFTNLSDLSAVFMKEYQWMMVLAIPFFFLYNGKRGAGLKYLFYVFYPVHLWILFYVGNIVLR